MDEDYTDFETSRQAYEREDETYLFEGPLPDDEPEPDVQVEIAEYVGPSAPTSHAAPGAWARGGNICLPS